MKTIKITSVLLLIVVFVSSSILLMGCGGKETAGGDASESEISTPASGASDAAETTPEASSETSEVPETVSEEIDISDVGKSIPNMRAYGFLKDMLYHDDNGSYNFYKFYNSFIEGKIDLTDPRASSFVEDCLEFFTENGMDDEAGMAKTVADAIEGMAE